jgi:cyclic pyranopterin monophosphate synthase
MTLSHVDEHARPTMVDVTGKEVTHRTATAESRVQFPPEVANELAKNGFNTAKGPVFHTAIIAGTMAAKRTHELIPLCHPLPVSNITVDIAPEPELPGLAVRARVKVTGRTGVEMEALTAVAVACLTIYDMVKALERGMRIEGIRLLEKRGGKSGHYRAKE